MKKLTNRQKQGINTRLRIIKMGLELLKDSDFDSVKVKDICEKSNISVGAFYHHFQSKEDIINDSYKEFDLLLEDKIENIKCEDTFKTIHSLIETQMEYTQLYGYKIPIQIFKSQLTAENKYILNENRYYYKCLKETVEKGLRNNEIVSELSSKEITDTILRLVRGIVYDWCLHEGNYNLTECAHKDLDLLLANFKCV